MVQPTPMAKSSKLIIMFKCGGGLFSGMDGFLHGECMKICGDMRVGILLKWWVIRFTESLWLVFLLSSSLTAVFH